MSDMKCNQIETMHVEALKRRILQIPWEAWRVLGERESEAIARLCAEVMLKSADMALYVNETGAMSGDVRIEWRGSAR